MQKQQMSKSYALLWFYDVFFCHTNALEKERRVVDEKAFEEEFYKESWDRRWPDEDEDQTRERFTTYRIFSYRPRFAKKSGKTLREIKLYEKQIKAYEAWTVAGRQEASKQPWYYVLLDLFDLLLKKKEVRKADFLSFYGLNERTFKRYLHTIRTYEKGKGRFEFALAYDAKKKIYHATETGFVSPVIKETGMKTW
jgi:hypothetical protein